MTAAGATERKRGPEVPLRKRRRGLGLLEVVTLSLRSIRANIMRSILTTLGIIIGVASVVTLTAVGNGVNREIAGNLTSFGTNLLTINSAFGRGSGGFIRGPARPSITVADAQAIRDLADPRVVGVVPVQQSSLQLKAGSNNTNATVIGTWPDFAPVRNSEPDVGTFLSEADVAARNRVAVLGFHVAQELFPAGGASGGRVRIGGVTYTVLGVLPERGASFNSTDDSVLIPLSTFLQRIGRQSALGAPTVQTIHVAAADPREMTALQRDLELLLAARHDTLTPDTYDFRIQNQADALESLNQVTGTLNLFLGAIAGISLLVGGIGIMNIMLVSVTERTREIGVRKALGAKPRDILAQFLTESFVLSVGGGLLGIVVGLALALGVVPLIGLQAVPSVPSISVAFAFAAAVGIFFGFYPARRAARLDPVESLRYE